MKVFGQSMKARTVPPRRVEDSRESDIDLFIETSDRPAVHHRISPDEKILSRKLSPIIVSPEESAQLRTRDRPLYERIRQGKIPAGEQR